MIVNFGRDLWGGGSPGHLIRLALLRFLFFHVSVFNFASHLATFRRFSKKFMRYKDERKPDYV